MDAEKLPEWLVNVRQAYLKTAEDKISQLSRAIELYVQDPCSEDHQRHLYRLLHNLIGSAGSYGFTEVSSIARSMSDLLKRSQSPEHSIPVSALSSELQFLLEQLRSAFISQ